MTVFETEKRRLELQASLDAGRPQEQRNRRGQFATPPSLARDILECCKGLAADLPTVSFLDPALGTGAFYSALRSVFRPGRIDRAVGYEVDDYYGEAAAQLWRSHGLDVRVADFTHAPPPKEEDRFDLIVCNPPYVRHHHLTGPVKAQLRDRLRSSMGIRLNGLAGLYCYFLCLCHEWMKQGGAAAWLIPSEFMDVNYGREVKRHLLDAVELVRIHVFDPDEVQFDDALVSSAVVFFRKRAVPHSHQVKLTFGGSLHEPVIVNVISAEALRREPKWTRLITSRSVVESNTPRLCDYFTIKRGIATGANKFFILTRSEIERRGLPVKCFRPVLPSPRYLQGDEVEADPHGNPLIDKELFLLDCRVSEEELRRESPELHEYLEEGREDIAQRYLCSKRQPWYAQEVRAAAPFLCTYIGRKNGRHGRPFRFILNHSEATVTNVYLMLYPKKTLRDALKKDPELARAVLDVLNSIEPEQVLREGRFYGGGLHKIEPKELAMVPVGGLAAIVPCTKPQRSTQMELFVH